MACLDSPSLVLDYMQVGSSLPTRTWTHLGLSLPAYGMVRLESFSLLLDFITIGLTLFLRSRACADSSLLVYGMT